MERGIPLYSYDGELLQWIDAKRLDRLVRLDRIFLVVKHPKGRVAELERRLEESNGQWVSVSSDSGR